MYTETIWQKPIGGQLVYHGLSVQCTCLFQLSFSSSFESRILWICFLGRNFGLGVCVSVEADGMGMNESSSDQLLF